ncbi:hypothetical protein LOCC1_G002820 [Lachnellula occidentalis]|uniref:SRPBCC domain-containing protein n=1 Tax=Lachnellula occidentalis TaxID=215460 RepID=A0A8H8UI11_9HELO|nr:hypothetical protein LOCC1_G002820 [Lachnellula occidentalis]
MIHTTIEINRAPEIVRKVFLDFSSYQEWHQGMVKEIKPLSDSPAVGNRVHCEMLDLTFDAIITSQKENSPAMFQWQGPPVVGISGLHTFSFEPSEVAAGGTTFVHKEEFSGAMSFLMQSWLVGWSMPGKFDGFNRDLKKRVESL